MRPFIKLVHQLSLFSLLTISRADSEIFSQFVGASTIPATFTGSLAASMTICTNYLHGVPDTTGLPASVASQLFQEDVDGVCEFCSSLGQTRIDSCCAAASSSACFNSFGGNASPATATATGSTVTLPASITGTSTTASSATGTATTASETTLTGSAAAATKSSDANKYAAFNLVHPVAIAMLGFLI